MGGELGVELAGLEAGWALEGLVTPDGCGLGVDGDLGAVRGGRGRLAGAGGAHECARYGEGIVEDGVGVKGGVNSGVGVLGSVPLVEWTDRSAALGHSFAGIFHQVRQSRRHHSEPGPRKGRNGPVFHCAGSTVD